MEFYIAGVQFRKEVKENGVVTEPSAVSVIRTLELDSELTLEPEPTNNYDPNAVKIMYKENHLGYVPKVVSASISALLEDKELKVQITELNKEGKTWNMCRVKIIETGEAENPTQSSNPADF